MNIIFRKALTAEDTSGCKLVDTKMGFTTNDKVFAKSIEDGRLFVAKLGNQIIGYIRYGYLWDNEVAVLQMIRVLPEERGKGVGRELVQSVEEVLKKLGVRQLLSSTDESNDNSYKFHKSLGFKECGELDINEDQLKEVFFSKKI
ncbi:MAG: GNAT family N-acetyltransferase [Pseudomonadales bacterium]|nr:GNAT family N-acetyltransferase [Pseudomonadales bacterium]